MPKLVHAAWFQGEAALPPAYQRTAAALRATNPGWTVLLHDAASLRAACRAADDLAGGGLGLGALAGYDAAELLIQKVDLGRYAAAYAYGGVTCDVDVDVLAGFERLPDLEELEVLAASALVATPLESLAVSLGTTTRLCNNACLLAPRRDEALGRVLAECAARTLRASLVASWPFASDYALTQSTTGPAAFTAALRRCPAGSYRVLPPRYFEFCRLGDPDCPAPSGAILRHRFAGHWLSPSLRAAALWGARLRRRCGHASLSATVPALLLLLLLLLLLAPLAFELFRRLALEAKR